MKKLLLFVLLLQSSYAFADFWTSLNSSDAKRVRTAVVQQNNRMVLYCPGCGGGNGMFEYYQVGSTETVPSDWDKGKLEVKTSGTVIFKAIPVVNNGIMSFKKIRCYDDKSFKESKLDKTGISTNYHFLLENDQATWLSFAKLLGHQELPRTPQFTIDESDRKTLETCVEKWQQQSRK